MVGVGVVAPRPLAQLQIEVLGQQTDGWRPAVAEVEVGVESQLQVPGLKQQLLRWQHLPLPQHPTFLQTTQKGWAASEPGLQRRGSLLPLLWLASLQVPGARSMSTYRSNSLLGAWARTG